MTANVAPTIQNQNGGGSPSLYPGSGIFYSDQLASLLVGAMQLGVHLLPNTRSRMNNKPDYVKFVLLF